MSRDCHNLARYEDICPTEPPKNPFSAPVTTSGLNPGRDFTLCLINLFMLQAVTFMITAKVTLSLPRVQALPISCFRLSSELVASIPDLILYSSLNFKLSCSTFLAATTRSLSVNLSLLCLLCQLTGHLESFSHLSQASFLKKALILCRPLLLQ